MYKKIKLSKQEICYLYDRGEKTLEEIGQVANVSGTRIGQLLNEWGHPRYKRHSPRKDKFTDLNSYFEHCKETSRQNPGVLLRLLKPHLKRCENCGTTRHLRFKYRRWPIKSLRDVRVLCPSCLNAPTWGKGLDGLKQREIFFRHASGERVDSLAEEFRVSSCRIYQIVSREKAKREAKGCYP